MNDADYVLIQATGRGDHGAFEELMLRYQHRLLNFIARRLGDRYSAEDLTQEVFLRVLKTAGQFEPRGKVSTWLFTIAYHLCADDLKRRRRQAALELDCRFQGRSLAALGKPDPALQGEWVQMISRAIQVLPDNQRAALLLRVQSELSYAEISEVLGVSVASVESLLFRARRRLREILDGQRKDA